MLPNFRRLVIVLGAALVAGAPALRAQSGQPVRGDVDGDGRVTAADARIVSDFLVGKPLPAGANVRDRGDVNGDGRVTSVDAAIIARAAAGRDVSRFPVGAPTPGNGGSNLVECAGDVRARLFACGAPGTLGDLRAARNFGGQNLNVRLISGPPTVNLLDSTFTFTVRVKNLLAQSMGVDSATGAVNANGVRVFFGSGPTMTEANPMGSGSTITVLNAGTATFTAPNQKYYQYSGADLGPDNILTPQDSSELRTWTLKFDSGVNKFNFLLYINTELQYPQGWVNVLPGQGSPYLPPPVDSLLVGQTKPHSAVSYSAFGQLGSGPDRWSSNNAPVASVDATTGLVTAVALAPGVDLDSALVTAIDSVLPPTPPGYFLRTGVARVLVARALAPTTTSITALPTAILAGDTSLITVQVRDGFGRTVNTGGATVTLTTTLDSLVVAGDTGTTVTANDVGNGTYTAKLAGRTAGVATITGTVNTLPITDNATVTITAAVPENIVKTGGDAQNGTVGGVVANPFTVHVTDHYGNPVPNVTINLAVAGGAGSFTGSAVITNPSGNASVPAAGWTLGNGGAPPRTTNQLSATVVGGANPSTTFVAYVPAFALAEISDAMGNTRLDSNVAPNVPNALANDYTINGGAVSLKPAFVGALTTERLGTVNMAPNGSFTYLPPVGNVLRDSVAYEIQDTHYTGPAQAQATGYLKFSFVGKVWYVDNTFGGGADGRSETPFTTIAAAATAAGVNDSILVKTGSGTTAGGTLKAGQLVYGQGASAAFSVLLNGSPIPFILLSAGAPPSIGALTVASGNTLRGFTSSGGISGSAFGTLTVNEVGINNPSGPALSLANGTLSGSFTTLTSGGGTNNVLLTSVAGTSMLGALGNTLSGATGDAFKVDNGAGSFTYPGNITSTGVAVNVLNKSGGTVTLSGSVTSSAAGAGISVASNSGGNVTFSGDINPAAAAAGISVANNTGGTVTFSGANKKISTGAAAGVSVTGNAAAATIAFTGGGLTIASTTGTPFTATGAGTVEVSGPGNTLSVTGAAARAVNLSGVTIPAGGITFASITSSGTTTASAFTATSVAGSGGGGFTAGSLSVTGTTGGTSRGIELTTNSAPFTFILATVGGTGGEGIYLNGNTGAVAVNSGSVATTAGDALAVSGGNAGVTVVASLAKTTAGRVANVGSRTGGTVAVSGSLSCTGSCTGLLANGNSGGTIDFSNATKTFSTGANTAVSLTSNTGATINFSSGGLGLTTSSGTAFNATGGGTVNVTGALNTVSTTAGGVGVNIQNTTIGSSHVTFRSVNKSTGSAYGIRLENTGTSGGFKVTGDGSTALSGGTITQSSATNSDSAAVTLASTGSLGLEFMRLSINTGSGSSGIVGSELSGTNLVQKSVIDFNNVAPDAVPLNPAYAARFVQNSTNSTITLDGVTLQNKLDGTTAGSLSAGGTATVNFNVIDSNTGDGFGSTMQGLFGSGWVISSGDTGGSTGTVNVTIRDSRFQNAAANGTNNLEIGANALSTLNYKVKDNQFLNVANATFLAGIVTLKAFDGGVVGGTTAMDSIVGNTITNSGTGSAVTDRGYRGINVFMQSTTAATHRVVIANNTVTDLWQVGVALSPRNLATGHFKLINNIIGTAALPVGQANFRGLLVEPQDGSVMNLEMTGNSFFGAGTSDSNASVGLRVGTTTGTQTLNATVVGNTIGSTSAGTSARFRAEAAATGTGSLCLDLRTNTLDGATKTFGLTQSAGTFRVEGAGAGAVTNASIQAANSVGTGNVSGTVLYNSSANCAQPPI